jgi:tetratricopeptide (TPR) repeat protein
MNDIFVLAQQAIEEALASNWKEAIAKNQEILLQNPRDLEAKNRLAKAYLEIGKVTVAKKLYQEVLEVDPYNQIALKNLKRIARFNGNSRGNNKQSNQKFCADIFLSEPGKTKLVNLIHLATPQELSTLSPGEQLKLQPKKHTVCVIDMDDRYIGALPDDISHLLISLMAGGNLYEVYIKKATINSLQVILWEKYRSERFTNQPSFLQSGKVKCYPYVKEETGKNERESLSEFEEELIEEGWSFWK